MAGRLSPPIKAFGVVAIVIASFSAREVQADETHRTSQPQKGPHGGRLLSQDAFAIEVTIFERGVPPEYRVFAYAHGKPIDPSDVTLSLELRRLGGRTDYFQFTPRSDYLRGDKVVEEPHSFDVTVHALWKGQKYSWSYDSYEGRTEISAEAAKEAGITIGVVGPADITVELPLVGRLIQDSDQTIRVSARYPGMVKLVKKRLGDEVKKGELLAVIEGHASLNPFEVRAPLNGTVTKKNINAGENVMDQDGLFEITNLESLLVEWQASRDDLRQLQIGQPVVIDLGNGLEPLNTRISYIAPLSSPLSQAIAVRAPIPNPNRRIIPGLVARGKVQIDKKRVDTAVKKSALQTFRDWTVVFLQEGNTYEIRPLELGREDAEWVEVLAGIEAGQNYVMEGSFVVKADIGKTGATHDH